MKGFAWKSVLLVCTILSAITANFGQVANPAVKNEGSYAVFGFGTSHDSSLGWTSVMNSGVGYDFNRAFSIEAGIPFYFVSPTATSTNPSSSYNSLGDAYLSLGYLPQLSHFRYKTVVTGTVPTGDTANGISTGRVTGAWNNRFEKDLSIFTPFLEAGLSNSLSSTQRYNRPYTTLGLVTLFTAGTDIDLGKGIGLELSAYDVLPIGDQKVYSHGMARNGNIVSSSPMQHGRHFEQNAVTSGDSSLTKEHGFTGGFSFSPMPRVSIDANYTRSITYALDTVSAGVSFRLGHMPRNNVGN